MIKIGQGIAFLFLLAFVAGSLHGQRSKGKGASSPGGGRTALSAELEGRLDAFEDVTYATYGETTLQMDIYRPKAAGEKKLPGIVCIHGGGWWQGDRKHHGTLAKALADRGFVAATISYRLSGEAPFPAQIEDCKAAVRFLRANAEKYGIDRRKIGATGLSAGGHLTALLGSSGGVAELEGDGGYADRTSMIQAAVPMGAQSDFNAPHIRAVKATPPAKSGEKPNIWTQFLGGTPEEVPEQYRLASPMTHLDKGDPPMLFITGELDNEATHADGFRAKMRELGIGGKLLVIADAPHPFLNRQDFFDEAVDAAAAWFGKYLGE